MKCLLTQAHHTGKRQSTKWRLCIFISMLPKLWEPGLAHREAQLGMWCHGRVGTGHWWAERAGQALQPELGTAAARSCHPLPAAPAPQHCRASVASQIWCSEETTWLWRLRFHILPCAGTGSASFSALLSPSYHIPCIVQSITLKSPVWSCLAQFTFTKPPEISIQLKSCQAPFKRNKPSTQRKLQSKTSSLAM